MSYPVRKKLRLESYHYSEYGWYFITICTKNKLCLLSEIFSNGFENTLKLKPYGNIAEKYLRNIPDIEKYVIMPNHIHMLIKNNGDGNISQRISSFKTLVTKELKKSIFQRSYYDHIVRNEADYTTIWNYIDGNPQKWEADCYFS